MIRLFTKDATGVAPNGRWYAGDVNALQDAVAALTDLTQTISLGTLKIGETGLQLLRYAAGEARISGAFRTDGIIRALGGWYAGSFTTTARDAIALGSRPYGLVITNTTTNRLEWNSGTDPAPVWIALGAPLASPAFTGTPTAPTPATADNSTTIATTAFVKAQGYATLASPVLTGTPTAPTPATADNTTKIATTAYVQAQGYLTSATAGTTYAPLASPALTGTPTAPTPLTADNTTKVATTAYVKAQLVSPALTGTPTAPTPATADNSTTIATTAYVKAQGYATLASPAFTGTPTAPTPATADNTTKVATTAYVQAQTPALDRVNTESVASANGTGANGVYADLGASNCTTTVPSTGTYRVSFGAHVNGNTSATTSKLGISKNAAAPFKALSFGYQDTSEVARETVVALVAGDVLTLQHQDADTTRRIATDNRWLNIVRLA